MTALGAAIGLVEGWGAWEGVYFAFITGYTIGYGYFAPTILASRILAIVIATLGISLTGVIASVAVKALHDAMPPQERNRG